MTEYIYIVKCPGCEDEMFNFFTDARMQCDLVMSKHPIITQVEVERNDFGECTDHHDLGTVWSWEEAMKDTEGGYTEAEPAKSIFTKDDLKDYIPDSDPEFDNIDNSVDFEVEEPVTSEVSPTESKPITETADSKLKTWICYYDNVDVGTVEASNRDEALEKFTDEYRDRYIFDHWDHDWDVEEVVDESQKRKPIPDGMTIEQLVEEMEENEDEVECALCNDLFDKDTCRKELNLGWLCRRCADDLVARGEGPVFKEDNYWDFLDEDIWDDARKAALDATIYAPDKYYEFEFTHDDSDYGELEVVFSESYADILEALKEIVDDDYVREQSEDDEPQTKAEWQAAGKWDEFFTGDITTHISNLYDELVEYFEEDREAAIKEVRAEAEEDFEYRDGPGGGAFTSWDDFWRWKEG